MKPLDDAQIKEILEAKRPARKDRLPAVIIGARAILQAALALGILIGGYWIADRFVATKPEVAKRPTRERVYTVETQTVRLATHQPSIRAYGQIMAGRSVELRALVAGTVTKVHPGLKVGAQVAAGDALVTVDAFDYLGAVTEAKANLAESEAGLAESKARLAAERSGMMRAREQLAFAQRDLERIAKLHERGRMTDRDLDERRLLVSQRQQAGEERLNRILIEEAGVSKQEAALGRLHWRLAEAERNLADTALHAPFDGVVLAQNVEIGRTLNENDVAVSLYEVGTLEARVQLSDKQYGDLLAGSASAIGRSVEIYWYVGDNPVRMNGTIARIGAEISSERGGVEAYAAIDPAGLTGPIRPGAFVEIHIPGRRYVDTVKLPESVVYDGDHVFIVVDGRLVKRDVAIVGYDEASVLLTGAVQAGDAVLVTRIAEVGEGLKVRPEGPALAGRAGGGKSGDAGAGATTPGSE